MRSSNMRNYAIRSHTTQLYSDDIANCPICDAIAELNHIAMTSAMRSQSTYDIIKTQIDAIFQHGKYHHSGGLGGAALTTVLSTFVMNSGIPQLSSATSLPNATQPHIPPYPNPTAHNYLYYPKYKDSLSATENLHQSYGLR